MKLLFEAAQQPDDLDNIDAEIRIRKGGKDKAGIEVLLIRLSDEEQIGRILISPARHTVAKNSPVSPKTLYGDGPCDGAYVVRSAYASSGWGPLLYDVAIEIATLEATGLTPDRDHISHEALAVWAYYDQRRSDVDHKQLDDPDNTLTSIQTDNCVQNSSKLYPGDFEESPLSKVYTKSPETMAKLLQINKLKIEDEFSFGSTENTEENEMKEGKDDWVWSENFSLNHEKAAELAARAALQQYIRDLRIGQSGERMSDTEDRLPMMAIVKFKEQLQKALTQINLEALIKKYGGEGSLTSKAAEPSQRRAKFTPGSSPRFTPGYDPSDLPKADDEPPDFDDYLKELRTLAEQDPCWDEYEMVGTKDKDGLEVPNCVPRANEAEEVISSPSPKADVKKNLDSLAKQKSLEYDGLEGYEDEDELELAPGEMMEFTQKLEARLRESTVMLEAKYQDRRVTLNKPFRDPTVDKKFSVYIKDGKQIKKVNFGDPSMKIRNKSGSKTKVRHWSCKKW